MLQDKADNSPKLADGCSGIELSLQQIKELIPHRYPFLLIDRIVECVPGQKATGIKGVTVNEPFFVGHFPQLAVMPGVLIVESMAQTAGACVMHSFSQDQSYSNAIVYFASISQARFRQPVYPGDRLIILVHKINQKGNYWKFSGRAEVDGKLVAEATFSAKIIHGD